MTSWITRLAGLFALAAATAAAQPSALVVGAAVSFTGAHADLAGPYARGLQQWAQEVNASGGILGRPLELRLVDDGSEARRAGEAYRKLIEEGAQALIGPYGSAATLLAAAEAEAAQRVLINGAGWSRAVHSRGPRFVFQSAVPYGAYGNVMALARAAGISRAIILARDDPAAVEMANAAAASAAKLGIEAGAVQVFATSTVDFGPFVDAARAANVQAWVAFAEMLDAAEMVKTFKRLDYAPAFFYARGSSEAAIKDLLGQDAELALGAVRYHPQAPTPGNDRFVKEYRARWGAEPPAAAAEGYAAGTVLAAALKGAGATDPRKVREALSKLKTGTVLGEFRVDPETGAQLAAEPVLTQMRRGRVEIAWPESFRTRAPELPYPQWGEREYLK
jgi:branched-chain amino acid transport system substrate-binding protein